MVDMAERPNKFVEDDDTYFPEKVAHYDPAKDKKARKPKKVDKA